MRADAERNRRRILDAAREVFAEHGLGVGVDAVARAAGVGVGTLYRRFPTKEALLRAVIDDRVEHLRCRIEDVAAGDDPWASFAAAAETLAGAIARDHGFFEALQEAHPFLPAEREHAKRATIAAVTPILRRAQEAGVVRDDLVPLDVLGLCSVAARLPRARLEADPEIWRRYLGVVLDGMRAAAAHPLPATTPAERAPRAARA
jgi:AcrR family transcriptional regulator